MSKYSCAIRPFVLRFGQMGLLVSTAFLALTTATLAGALAPAPKEPISLPAPAPHIAIAAPAGPVTRQMTFKAPLDGFAVNSKFGLRQLSMEARARAHKGVDIAAPHGTPIRPSAEGTIVRVGYDRGGYGNFVEIQHPNGMSTLYAHMSRVDVRQGEAVIPSDVIGRVGSTGFSTGPHLHFEVRKAGVQVNPSKILGRAFEVKVDGAYLRNLSA